MLRYKMQTCVLKVGESQKPGGMLDFEIRIFHTEVDLNGRNYKTCTRSQSERASFY